MNARKIPGVDDPADPDEIEEELEQLQEEGEVMPTDKEKADKLAKDTQEQAQQQRQRQVTPRKIDPETATNSINEPMGSNVTPEPSTPEPVPEDPSRARAPVGQVQPEPPAEASRRGADKDEKEDKGDDKDKPKRR